MGEGVGESLGGKHGTVGTDKDGERFGIFDDGDEEEEKEKVFQRTIKKQDDAGRGEIGDDSARVVAESRRRRSTKRREVCVV